MIKFYLHLLAISIVIFSCSPSEKPSKLQNKMHFQIANQEPRNWRRIDDYSVGLDFGFHPDPIDLELEIKDSGGVTETEYLIFLWSLLDSVEVCDVESKCQKAGYAYAVKEWPVLSIFPVFPIQIKSAELLRIKVKIESRNHLATEIRLLTASELISLTTIYSGVLFVFLSLILFQIFYLVSSFFNLREKWLLYHILFSIGIGLVFLITSGLGSRFIFPQVGFSLSLFKKIIIGYLLITGISWVSSYLNTKNNFKHAHIFFSVIRYLTAILILLSFTSFPRGIIFYIFAFSYLSVTLVSIYLGFKQMEDHFDHAPWFILSMFLLLAIEVLNIKAYNSFDLYDSKIFLGFLAIFLPTNTFFLRQTVRLRDSELKRELYVKKEEIESFKSDLGERISDSILAQKKSTIAGIELEPVLEKLNTLLDQEKIYLEEKLRIGDLAAILGLTTHQVSEVLNQVMNISFPDLIKKYRIEESKKMIIENKKENFLNIAYAVGFNSKSSFNESFKKYTGLTPKEFRESSSN